MTAKVTISEIYWNKGLANFFFRDQAYETLENLIAHATDIGNVVLAKLDALTEGEDIDDVEENFYGESVATLAEMYDIELEDDVVEED